MSSISSCSSISLLNVPSGEYQAVVSFSTPPPSSQRVGLDGLAACVCVCVFGGLLAAEAMLGLPSAAAAKHSAAFPSFPSAPLLLPRTSAPTDWLNSCPGYIDVCVSVFEYACVFFFFFTVKHCQWHEHLHCRVKWCKSVCVCVCENCVHVFIWR